MNRESYDQWKRDRRFQPSVVRERSHYNEYTREDTFRSDESFIKTVKKEATKLEQAMTSSSTHTSKIHRKKVKKSIFISYSPDAGFVERKFVVETVRQLKENNLSEDIWFDKDERNTDSPCWFSFRLEAVERCRAATLFMSDSYFSCPVTMYEGKALMDRQTQDTDTLHIFPVLFSLAENTEIPKYFQNLVSGIVDLTTLSNSKEKYSRKGLSGGGIFDDGSGETGVHWLSTAPNYSARWRVHWRIQMEENFSMDTEWPPRMALQTRHKRILQTKSCRKYGRWFLINVRDWPRHDKSSGNW